MVGILERILETKKEEVARAQKRRSLNEVRRDAEASDPPRPFLERLSVPGPAGVNIIAEIKRASPSKGSFRSQLDPETYARAYERGGAAALSVLTDRGYFKGAPEDLIKARAAVSLPVLRKDFIVSAYQIYESRAMGADAVLLIVRAVPEGFLREAIEISRELRMAALVEVHEEDELDTALDAGARLVGVNHRNLRTFQMDLTLSRRLKERLPSDRVLVAESGIRGPEDVKRLAEAGIHNFLVGEALVRARNPEEAVRSLTSFQ